MDGRNGFSVHETQPSTGSPSCGWLSGDFAHSNNEARHRVEHLKSQQNWEKPRLANSGVYPDAQQENLDYSIGRHALPQLYLAR
jgi:hypothetical protein